MVRVISHNGFGRVRMALHLQYTSSIAGISCRDLPIFADNASVDGRAVNASVDAGGINVCETLSVPDIDGGAVTGLAPRIYAHAPSGIYPTPGWSFSDSFALTVTVPFPSCSYAHFSIR